MPSVFDIQKSSVKGGKLVKEKVVLASGSCPELLGILKRMKHPAYKEWRKAGYPTGNAGVIIRGWEDKIEIIPYKQIG